MRKLIAFFLVLCLSFLPLTISAAFYTEVAAAAPIKVACVGDSITYGFGHNDARSYPSVLGELLGDDYEVKNFGQGGATLMKKADAPYWNLGVYRSSLEYNPDIVIIMLGTNDAKHFNWVEGIKESFGSDVKAIIDTYRNLPSNPTVYYMTAPTAFNDGGAYIVPENINQIVPIQKAVASEVGCPIIDMNAFTKNLEERFPDNIHPDADGYAYFASIVSDVVSRGTTRPAPPINLEAKNASGRLVVMWDDSSLGGSYVKEYKVYLNGEYYTTVTNSLVTIKGLTNGEEYTVTVKSVNEAGESDFSESLTCVPTASIPKINGITDGGFYDLADGIVSATWTTSATATLDGVPYSQGTLITALGQHTLVVTNDNVVVTLNFTITDSSARIGDVDKDGEITVADALAVLRVAAKASEVDGNMFAVMDMDKDSEITVADALAVLRIAAKLV